VSWAVGLAGAMMARFQGYGGWTDHKVRAEIDRGRDQVILSLRGTAQNLSRVSRGWAATVTIIPDDTRLVVDFWWEKSKEFDPLELLMRDPSAKGIQFKNSEPQDKIVMAVSLYLSQQLNPYTDKK
jgi:hypothetical protein